MDHCAVEFFSGLVREWLVRGRIRVSDRVRAYVTHVLAEPATAPDRTLAILSQPLGRLYLEAMESGVPSSKRYRTLRYVGDGSLLLSGWWWQQHADTTYYVDLGRMAYGGIPGELFAELSGKFGELVDLLTRMEAQCAPQDVQETLRLYAFWLRTRDSRLERALLARGMVLATPDSAPS